MGVKLNTASGGSVSIEPTNTASNYTLTVPAQTGTVVASDSSGNVGIGTSSPTTGVRADIVSDNTSQQYVNVLKVKTSNTGDYHPAVLFENNRGSVSNEIKLCMDSGSTAGTGEFRVQAKDSGGTFNTRLVVSNAGNLQFNSGYGSAATAYGCRAWVNFNGTGTVAIRASGNVSSITDNGTGLYTVNLTNAMPDANYTVACCNNTADGSTDHRQQLYVNGSGGSYQMTTTTVQLEFATVDLNGTSRQDSGMVAIAIFR